MSAREQLLVALRNAGLAPDLGAAEITAASMQSLADELSGIADPNFECVFVGGAEGSLSNSFAGLDGMARGWADWLSAFESLEIQADELRETEGHLVVLGHQVARSATGGVEIESLATGVWTIRDEKLVRVEFHLDRDHGLRAAGLEPD